MMHINPEMIHSLIKGLSLTSPLASFFAVFCCVVPVETSVPLLPPCGLEDESQRCDQDFCPCGGRITIIRGGLISNETVSRVEYN